LISGGVGAIGIVGTVVTSVVGSRNTKRATEQAVATSAANTRATLLAAHDAWLREKRAAVYEEVLAGQFYRQTKRRIELRKHPWGMAGEQELKMLHSTYDSPGFLESQSRLAAYASDAVMAVSNAAGKAHGEVQARCLELGELREQIRTAQLNGTPQSAPDAETMMNANRQINSAFEAAEAADDALMVIIRTELRSKPEAAVPPPAEVPAVRRRIWRRRRAVGD
jgi:hypothetical protein